MKFKKGQKVKIIGSTYAITKESLEMIGKICEIKDIDRDGDILVYTQNKSNWWYFNESDLEVVPEEKTWDTLEVGDVLIYKDSEKTVLGVCGRVVFVSLDTNKDVYSNCYTKEEFIKSGWKIKQDTPNDSSGH